MKSIQVTVRPYYTVFPNNLTYQASVTVEACGERYERHALLLDDDFAPARFEQMMKEATREVLERLRAKE